jgi:uncharacterized protein (TIGR03437 family)
MLRRLVFLIFVTCAPVLAAKVQLLSPLPHAAVSRAMQLDAAGNIYLAGTFAPPDPQIPQNSSDAFVAKLSADGSKLIYFTTFGGSFNDDAAGIALAGDGSVYVTGSTESTDFPVTDGAFQTSFAREGASQGFLAKVDPSGAVVYASFINGKSFTRLTGIALDKSGNVFLTGTGGPDYPGNLGSSIQGFILKLDPALHTVLLSVYGYGGGLISLDAQGNIYVAGSAQPVNNGSKFVLPTLPAGAFQSTHDGTFCQSSAGPGGPFALLCQYQTVAKLDPAGKPLWATYVTGSNGAVAAGMSVDSAGNVIVAGTTSSSDYPVTPGAFQTAYTAAGPQPPHVPGFTGPPNSIGYVTKVNATGTNLVWSTYFGGSSQDQITGMAIAPSGEILLSGRAASSDLVFADTPDACRPTPNQVLGYVARLSGDGAAVAATQPVHGAPDCLYVTCNSLASFQTGWPLALRGDGSAIVAGAHGTVASVDFTASTRVACVNDPADNAQLTAVAPGQVVALYGANLAPADPMIPPAGVAPSSDTFGVFFNGIAAPLLYSSARQINVQVPYEIGSAATVQMQVVSKQVASPFSESRTLAVGQRQPAIFLSAAALASPIPGWSTCGGNNVFGQTALALNADGSVNDCDNPAAPDSVVTVFLNGFGPASPDLATGMIAPGPPVRLDPSLDPGPFTGTAALATRSLPGSISGVAQVQLHPGNPITLLNGASLAGVPLRERVILIWTK